MVESANFASSLPHEALIITETTYKPENEFDLSSL